MKSKALSASGLRKLDPLSHTIFIALATWEEPDGNLMRSRLLAWAAEVYLSNLKTGLPHAGSAYTVWAGTTEDDFWQLLQAYPCSRVVSHQWQRDAILLRIGSDAVTSQHGCYVLPDQSIIPPKSGRQAPFKLVLGWPEDQGPYQTHLVCNSNFYPKQSIGDLAEAVSIPRLDAPPLDDLDAVKRHCARDAQILSASWFKVHSITQELAKVDPGLTIGQTSMRVFLRGSTEHGERFWDPNLWPEQVIGSMEFPEANRAERLAYHGGRADVFWHGPVPPEDTRRQYDVNSLYPAMMKRPVPIRFIGEAKEPDLSSGSCWLCLVLVDVPPDGLGWLGFEGTRLPDIGMCYPCGKQWFWLWDPMLRIAFQQGWVVKIKRVFEYAAAPIFRTWAFELYRWKQMATGSERQLFKLMLNGLYGKFGQHRYGHWERYQGPIDQTARNDLELGQFWAGGDFFWPLNGETWRWKEAPDEVTPKAITAIAGWITAAGRAFMWLEMAKLIKSGYTLFYTDTDSIITDGVLPTGEGLGQWRLEAESTNPDDQFIAPKHLFFGGKATLSGAPEPVIGEQFQQIPQMGSWSAAAFKARGGIIEDGVLESYHRQGQFCGENRTRDCRYGTGPTNPFVLTRCPKLPG